MTIKSSISRSMILISGVVIPLYLTGCASVAVSDSDIEQKAAQTLGLQKGSFKVSDRMDNGIQTHFSVQADSGEKYSCYVTGAISVVGATVSDAICNSATAAASKPQTDGEQCNALLKAAGKCSG